MHEIETQNSYSTVVLNIDNVPLIVWVYLGLLFALTQGKKEITIAVRGVCITFRV